MDKQTNQAAATHQHISPSSTSIGLPLQSLTSPSTTSTDANSIATSQITVNSTSATKLKTTTTTTPQIRSLRQNNHLPSNGSLVCSVCGDTASGYHYRKLEKNNKFINTYSNYALHSILSFLL